MNKRGAILLIVLLIMASVAVGVIAIEEWASKNYDFSEELYIDNQAAFYFHSAIKVAIKLLKNDNNKYDSKNDDWFKLPPFRVNRATIVYMSIIPENEKINVNNLTSENKKLSRRTEDAMSFILGEVYANPKSVIDEIREWMSGKEEGKYYGFRYKPIRGLFYSLKELDFVNGLGDFSAKFHKIFTVSGSMSKINVNFASAKVMEAYLPEIADCVGDIIKYRDRSPFKNVTQLRKVGCISDDSYIKILPYITTSTTRFIVKVSVDISGIRKYSEAVLERNGNSVRVIKYFEGKGFYE